MLPVLLGGAFAVQPPGQFHAGEAVARDGERWLALDAASGHSRLVPAVVRVRAVEDALLDEPGQRTGREVSSPVAPQAVAFLRGPGLRAGPVPSATVTEHAQAASPVPERRIELAGVRYRLATRCTPQLQRSDTAQALYDCTVTLWQGTRSQRLHVFTAYTETADSAAVPVADVAVTLLFAGDLDRDGRLDLLLDTSDHYNLSRPTLLLSAPAAPGALVQRVAEHSAVGC